MNSDMNGIIPKIEQYDESGNNMQILQNNSVSNNSFMSGDSIKSEPNMGGSKMMAGLNSNANTFSGSIKGEMSDHEEKPELKTSPSTAMKEIKLEPASPSATNNSATNNSFPSTPSNVDSKADIKTEVKTESNDSSESSALVPRSSAGAVTPAGGSSSTASKRKVFQSEELRVALLPSLEKLYKQDPESLPFRQPVDPQVLQIPDYFDIVKRPMDLSTIKKKLDMGQYSDPWQYVEDVWLMFDNAWLYNRKTSRVYRYCTKVSV